MNSSIQTIRVNAYAKINPYLEVTGRREDGYHTLLSHMQAVSLHDVLSLRWLPNDKNEYAITLTCDDGRVPCDDTNLVCRAARALLEVLRENGESVGGSWSFELQKNIPMAAGLAGGSADAAAALHAVNQLMGNALTLDELCEIGVRIGADVPFCLCCARGAMTARGIGEHLTQAPSLPTHIHLVIVCHGEGVSTPWAYRQLDEQGILDATRAEEDYRCFVDTLQSGDLTALDRVSSNCFERVVIPERAAVQYVMARMRALGSPFVRMSGSGPSVVAAFERERDALACAELLSREGIKPNVCRPYPLLHDSLS